MILTQPDRGCAWVILVASFGAHCIAGFCMYAVGLFHISISEKFHESVTLTSWLSSIFLCLLSSCGPLASFLIYKWSCRITMIIGSLLITIGLVVTAFSNNIFMVLVFFSLVAGVGIGLVFNSGYIVLAFNFEKKRNMATGIAVSGCGLGPFILVPLFQLIQREYGYCGFFLFMAGLSLQACVFGLVLRPSRLEMSSKLAMINFKPQNTICLSCDPTVVKNISVLCVALGGFFFNIGIFIIYLHFPQYAMDNGSSESEVSLYLSIAGICSCIGRILLGMASNSDNVNEDIVYFGSYVMLGVCTIIIPLFMSFHSAKVVYMIVLGLYNGTCYVVINTIVLKLVGPNHVAQGTGYVLAYIGIGTLIGPPIGGVIVDNGGTYEISFTFAGISLIIGGIIELCNVMFQSERYKIPRTGDFEIDVPEKTNNSTVNHR